MNIEDRAINSTQVYPVGGGKGGIGKSLIAANLGALLARQGNRVLLIDLDLGSSNLHTFVGEPDTDLGLGAFIDKTIPSLDRAVVPTQIPNLSFISSQNCGTEAANLYTAQKQKIIRAISRLAYDYIFMDLGAGTHFNMLDFFLTSNQGICIVTSEPTSIENTFNFIKAVYFRVVKRTLKLSAFNRVTRDLDLSDNSIDQSFKIIKAIEAQDPKIGELLKNTLQEFHFKFVVNQVRQNDDPDLGMKIEKVCNRHFYSTFKCLGNVAYDDKVHDSIQTRQNFITKYTYTRAANDLSRVAKNFIEDDRARQRSG